MTLSPRLAIPSYIFPLLLIQGYNLEDVKAIDSINPPHSASKDANRAISIASSG